MAVWKTQDDAYPARELFFDPQARARARLPEPACFMSREEKCWTGEPREVLLDHDQGHIQADLEGETHAELSWSSMATARILDAARGATDREWQVWHSSFPSLADTPMLAGPRDFPFAALGSPDPPGQPEAAAGQGASRGRGEEG
eukprot:6894049-Alexandrium_andersonii.AAC.1